VWEPDRQREARSVFGTLDRAHPGVTFLTERSNPIYVGGRLHGCQAPTHYDFKHLRETPAELRTRFEKLAGARSSRSRPAIRCTARIRS
jgi:sulfate adenylyltransferase